MLLDSADLPRSIQPCTAIRTETGLHPITLRSSRFWELQVRLRGRWENGVTIELPMGVRGRSAMVSIGGGPSRDKCAFSSGKRRRLFGPSTWSTLAPRPMVPLGGEGIRLSRYVFRSPSLSGMAWSHQVSALHCWGVS